MIEHTVPVGRRADTEELAGAALLPAGPAASYMTGTVLTGSLERKPRPSGSR
ncbi:hypothetical protein ACIRU3_45720 [Streptomyces sp. NPDC101151]|uniref:hypothetical protein n=1 Tax=Streptomyces sp. NPDC101151 TaxID=3366115 RepID=UPI00382FE009